MSPAVIEGVAGSARLRGLEPEDAEVLAEQANDRAIWINLRDRMPYPYRLADAQCFIARATAERPRRTFAIIAREGLAGVIGFEPGADIHARSAELGYWLGRRYWGRGIATAAVHGATLYGFERLDLLRIYATPFAANHASRRVLEKAGYRLEGIMRKSAVKEGRVIDQALYAIVRP